MLVNTGLSSNKTSLRCCLQMFVETMVSGYTELLYYVGNNRTSNSSSLTMLLGNTPLNERFISE